MYLGIDIGGTKTLLTVFTMRGEAKESIKFPTPQNYKLFIRELAKVVANLSTKSFRGCAVAVPGKVDRDKGIGVACGNLPWENVPIRDDLQRITGCPVAIENDANLAGLSEAIAIQKEFDRVLYVTISTGIGTGIINGQEIDPDFQDSEGGHIILEHHGRRQRWEKFASGSAIVRRFGKRAEDIHDAQTWHIIARNIAAGLLDLSAIIQPQVIILGGGVSTYLDRFDQFLNQEMQKFNTPLTPVPTIRKAAHTNEAVVLGCYFLAKQYGKSSTKSKG